MKLLRGLYQYFIVTLILILTWIIAYNLNGLNVTINFFYFAVILAGRFWGIPGGIVTGLIAGILGGPLLPDKVSEDIPQNISQWSTRLLFYVVIGSFAGKLFSLIDHKNKELLRQKQELEVTNIEILSQRDEIIKNQNVIKEKSENLKQLAAGIVESLAQSIELRDPYTSGHCRRVSKMAVSIGERMGLDKSDLISLKWSATLHDIGKIGIPESILNKNGKLTPYEMDIMQQHPRLGVKVLEGIPNTYHIIDGVLNHHERLDGRGYPNGISGDQIGIQARIIAVCDVWDALTSKRAYRDAMKHDDALKIIESGRDTQFDSTVLHHFYDVLRTEK